MTTHNGTVWGKWRAKQMHAADCTINTKNTLGHGFKFSHDWVKNLSNYCNSCSVKLKQGTKNLLLVWQAINIFLWALGVVGNSQ